MSPIVRRINPAQCVFINCPFDSRYKPVFDAIVFTIFDCGFVARSALELVDSAENRLERIARIIENCDFAVHDISRTELDVGTNLPRFNMPFELGLYLGARRFGNDAQRRKNCLVMDKTRYRYQKFLSDIAGQDIAEHKNDPRLASRRVRDWLNSVSKRDDIPGAPHIWKRFEAFQVDLPRLAKMRNLHPADLQFKDLSNVIAHWLQKFGGP